MDPAILQTIATESDPEKVRLFGPLRLLTARQGRVLAMVANGLLNKQIAYELGVSEATIKAHVSAILLKLGVASRSQAVAVLVSIIAACQGG